MSDAMRAWSAASGSGSFHPSINCSSSSYDLRGTTGVRDEAGIHRVTVIE